MSWPDRILTGVLGLAILITLATVVECSLALRHAADLSWP